MRIDNVTLNRTAIYKVPFPSFLLGPKIYKAPGVSPNIFVPFLQISCVSSSTALRNRQKYPFYFQLLSAEDMLAFAYYGVIREYGWRQLVLIVQNENLFTVVSD